MIFLVAIYPRWGSGSKLERTYYDFENYGKIEAVSDLRELDLWTPHTGSIESGDWQYFRISNPFSNENILISVEPLNDSDVDVYVTKGLNTRPSQDVFLKKANGLGGDEIEIKQEDLIFGDKELRGDYIVGVYGVTDSKYSLIWQHSKTRLVRGIFNKPFTINLKSKLNQYLIFDNGSLKQDINFKFGSRTSDVRVYIIPMQGDSTTKNKTMPTEKHYVWHASLEPNGGTNKLRISQNDKKFCANCKYLVLLKCDYDTKVDLVLSRVSDTDLIQIIDNKYVVDSLRKGESQKYYYEIDSAENKFTIDIQIISGAVTFLYGKTED